jgi:hypothetical protein
MGWAADVDDMPDNAVPDAGDVNTLRSALDYIERGTAYQGPDAILSLGEPMRTAAQDDESGADANAGSVLLRLPHDVAVDCANGYVYQLQEVSALLLDAVPRVPASVLETYPGGEHLLRRALWAVAVHREHVAPYAELLDDALLSQFTKLDATAGA